MMGLSPYKPTGGARSALNLELVSILLLETNAMELEVIEAILRGFGANRVSTFQDPSQAEMAMALQPVDLFMIGSLTANSSSFDIIRLIRAQTGQLRFTPAMLLLGHASRANIETARDSGADLVLVKPATPPVLLDRLHRLARKQRPFIETATYMGPDRRFQTRGPPPGVEGRRAGDPGRQAAEPNRASSLLASR